MDEARRAAVGSLIEAIRDAQMQIEHLALGEKALAGKKRFQYASIDLETAVEHLRLAVTE